MMPEGSREIKRETSPFWEARDSWVLNKTVLSKTNQVAGFISCHPHGGGAGHSAPRVPCDGVLATRGGGGVPGGGGVEWPGRDL